MRASVFTAIPVVPMSRLVTYESGYCNVDRRNSSCEWDCCGGLQTRLQTLERMSDRLDVAVYTLTGLKIFTRRRRPTTGCYVSWQVIFAIVWQEPYSIISNPSNEQLELGVTFLIHDKIAMATLNIWKYLLLCLYQHKIGSLDRCIH